MSSPPDAWTITPEEVQAVRADLGQHFPGGEIRVLSDPDDPGQLFQVHDKEGSRYTLKLAREALDDLRARKVPLAQFLAKQEIARRMRHARRLVVLRARGDDMIREERS